MKSLRGNIELLNYFYALIFKKSAFEVEMRKMSFSKEMFDFELIKKGKLFYTSFCFNKIGKFSFIPHSY